jgi:hypothetical protein
MMLLLLVVVVVVVVVLVEDVLIWISCMTKSCAPHFK